MPKKKKLSKSKWKKGCVAGMTIARWLLEFLFELTELIPMIETPYKYGRRLEGYPSEFPRHRVEREIKRMKDRGWIIEAEKQGQKFFKLTKKGRMAALYRKLGSLPKPAKKQWHGRWVMAVFDIPEKGRKERDAIRYVLKTVGFYPLQKSVYIYPYEVPIELMECLKDKKLLKFVRFARIEQMDSVQDIKKYFRL